MTIRAGAERRGGYVYSLAEQASGIKAFREFSRADSPGDEIVTKPFGCLMAIPELILPATFMVLIENIELDETRPLRNSLLFIGALATDITSNWLIYLAGNDGVINIAARRIALNYATHIGAGLIQGFLSPMRKVAIT